VTERARLGERDAHPRDPELIQDQARHAVGERLHEVALRVTDVGEHALHDFAVIERVGDVIARRGVSCVRRELQVHHHGLLDAPLPLDEADDALGGESVHEDAVTLVGLVAHGLS
jgi:hypothetical protein